MINLNSTDLIIKEIISRSGYLDWCALELQEKQSKDNLKKVITNILQANAELQLFILNNKHWLENNND